MKKKVKVQFSLPVPVILTKDKSIVFAHYTAEEPNQRGVVGYRMYIEPSKKICEMYHLKRGVNIDEEGLVNVWYPKKVITFEKNANRDIIFCDAKFCSRRD